MKAILLPFLMICFFATAQKNAEKKEVDSVAYYRVMIHKLRQAVTDSLHRTEGFKALQKKLTESRQKSKSYAGLAFHTEIVHSDYARLNDTLAKDGFSKLNPVSGRYGLGVAARAGNAMYYLYFGTIGSAAVAKKGNESVTTSFSNFLQLELGIDLLDLERVSFYPYAGGSIRVSEIRYRKRGQPNFNYTNFSNMRTDDNDVLLNSIRLGYQYGVGLDFSFAYNRDRTFKTVLFVKAGVNKPSKRDIYKSDGLRDYSPGIKQGTRVLTIGIKLGNKQ
jgi:hypothetical protein